MPDATPQDLLYGTAKIADFLGIKQRAVEHLIETKRIPFFRLGNALCRPGDGQDVCQCRHVPRGRHGLAIPQMEGAEAAQSAAYRRRDGGGGAAVALSSGDAVVTS